MANTNTNNARITSIDFLRAFALLGIIIVHFRNGFGLSYVPNRMGEIDNLLWGYIGIYLVNRCAIIFNILFGVSFYLILRKPQYSEKKFLFRCFLLFLIGLFNKLFYSFDALMWYGICGMILVAFRYLTTKTLPIAIIILYFLKYICSYLVKECVDLPVLGSRYQDANILQIIFSWPQGVVDYFLVVIRTGIFGTLANFLIGYYIGLKGWLYKLDRINIKTIIFSSLAYIALAKLQYINNFYRPLFVLSGGASYTIILMWLYYHTPLRRLFEFLCPYGKLGLTNYSTQGIIGVIIFNLSTIRTLPFSYIVMLAIAIYTIQAIISYYWLKFFQFGPMEWIWRCLTNRRFTSMRINQS